MLIKVIIKKKYTLLSVASMFDIDWSSFHFS